MWSCCTHTQVSSSSSGTIIGFSFSGASIPIGEGVLCIINSSSSNDNSGELWVDSPVFSSPEGTPYSVDVGDNYIVQNIDATHFNIEIPETGQSTLFIFQDTISSLEAGDEVGIFDANGYIDDSGNFGEILVGAGIWNNEQLEVVGIMGEDLSNFGGPVLPGAIQGNQLLVKIWKIKFF